MQHPRSRQQAGTNQPGKQQRMAGAAMAERIGIGNVQGEGQYIRVGQH